MPSKATEVNRGINRSAGKSRNSMKPVSGGGNTVTPLGTQKAPREERSAAHSANRGNELLGNPTGGKHSYK